MRVIAGRMNVRLTGWWGVLQEAIFGYSQRPKSGKSISWTSYWAY